MNKTRRKTINGIYERLYELRNLLEEVKDEEDDEAVGVLDSAISSLEEALDYLESATRA